MRKNIANIITGIRILCNIWLLFFPVFSIQFYILYLACGLSDIIDGSVARKTKSVTAFGSKLDSTADFLFIGAVFIRLLPVLNLPRWLWLWSIMIGIIKIINVTIGFICNSRYVVEHTCMNKLTGFLLFFLPMTIYFVELKYSATVICTIALFSAIQEGYYVLIGKEII